MRISVLLTLVTVVCAAGVAVAAESEKMAVEPDADWGLHTEFKDCVSCHVDKPDPDSTDKPEMVAPVPQLCYTCHEERAAIDGWKHGPVATGECLLCHQPHQAGHKPLLKKAIPELCYHCHETKTLALVTDHSKQSHASCTDCHEAHASPGRMLLNRTYLQSEAGQEYIGNSAYAYPRPTFVDRRGSLGGLEGVEVIAMLNGSKSLGRYGVTEDLVRMKAEEYLRGNGIGILTSDEHNERKSLLRVQVRLMAVPLTRGPRAVDALAANINICLQQAVELPGTDRDGRKRFCSATTWDTGAIAIWGVTQVKEGFGEATKVLVNQFCEDYLDANPRDSAPALNADARETPP